MKRIFPIIILISSVIISCNSSKQESASTNGNSNNSSDPNEYYDNGNIRIEKIIEGNHEHWIFKQEDGGCWEEKFFKDGEEYKRIVYNSNCVKSAEYELKNGNRNGEWISYHDNGKIREKGFYQDGLSKGNFQFYDESEKLISIEECFIIDSTHLNIFNEDENNLVIFKEKLKNEKNFLETENIEVAGNRKYHFPELHWGTSKLFFDELSKSNKVKCVSGTINDKGVFVYGEIGVNSSVEQLQRIFRIRCSPRSNLITLHDLKNNLTVSFKNDHFIITSIDFQHLNKRN